MAFRKPTINVVKPDIKNASIYLRSVKKWGKSTLFARVIEAKYGDPKYGLLVEIGNEIGTTILDNVNTVHVDTYTDFMDLQKWLIDTKGTEHDIQIAGFDTTDEMVEIFEKEVIHRHNAKNPAKPITSINAAFGGFGEGPKMAAKLMKEYFNTIRKAGIQTWAIGHTKYKSIKDKGSTEDDAYMQLTSNLSSQYEAALGDTFDIVLTGMIDRDTHAEGEGDKVKKKVDKATRKLYFRGTPEIDAGGRFASDTVPEFMVFDGDMTEMAKKFINVIEDGMINSRTMTSAQEAVAIEETKKAVAASAASATSKGTKVVDFPETDELPFDVDEPATAGASLDARRAAIKETFQNATKELKTTLRDIIISNGTKLDEADEKVIIALEQAIAASEA